MDKMERMLLVKAIREQRNAVVMQDLEEKGMFGGNKRRGMLPSRGNQRFMRDDLAIRASDMARGARFAKLVLGGVDVNRPAHGNFRSGREQASFLRRDVAERTQLANRYGRASAYLKQRLKRGKR